MPVEYVAPLHRAWTRAKSILFGPFDLKIWFVLGFTCWLARLWDNAGFGGSRGWNNDGNIGFDPDDIDFGRDGSFDWFGLDGLGVGLLLMLVFCGLLLAVLFAWLSSRGEFMFLDNVVHRRARVTEPWRRYGTRGDSLFLWRVCTQVLVGVLALALIMPGLLMIWPIAEGGVWVGLGVAGVLTLGFAGLALGLLAALVNFWTDSFVVPLMYRYDLNILEGWLRFLPLLQSRPAPFLLFALIFLLLTIGVGLAVAIIGLATCCIGWMLLAIPYIGTVILLPFYTTGRAFGPEFIVQFGEEYRLWNGNESDDDTNGSGEGAAVKLEALPDPDNRDKPGRPDASDPPDELPPAE